eukprot:2937907-Heterocapsa_arctica.AAC.1
MGRKVQDPARRASRKHPRELGHSDYRRIRPAKHVWKTPGPGRHQARHVQTPPCHQRRAPWPA